MSKKIIKLILPFLLILFLIPYNEMTIRTNSLVNNNGLPTFQADPIIIIDDDTDFGPSGYNFPGTGSDIDPYIIEGFNIEALTVDDVGILVTGTTMHFEIKNNDIDVSVSLGGSYADIGISVVNVAAYTAKIINNHIVHYGINIYVEEAEGVIVEDNDCERAGKPGILLEACPHARVENNLVYGIAPPSMKESKLPGSEGSVPSQYSGKYYGIYLGHCSDSNITLNKLNLAAQTNGAGIAVFYSSRIILDENLVEDVIIPHPDFANDERGGLYLNSVSNSTIFKNTVERTDKCNLFSTSCDRLLISNNSFSESEETGISLYSTTNSTIIHNVIQDHPSFGIEISTDSANNTIHHNHFIDNNIGGSQGSDSGTDNTWWDITTDAGNWWNDWTGGDYVIAGTAGSVDPFPLGEPVVVPEFSKQIVISLLLMSTSIVAIPFIRRRKNN